MVKVTIEHERGTEVIEAEMFFGVGTTADKENKAMVATKTVLVGEGSNRHLIASGNGVRKVIDTLQQTEDDAMVSFLIGLAPECAPKPGPIQKLLARFKKEEQK